MTSCSPLTTTKRNIDLLRIKTGEAEIEIRLIELLQLESEEFLIPSCPGYGTVHQEAGFHLRFAPLVAEDYGDFGRVAAGPCSQLARGFKSQMAVHHFASLRTSTGILNPNSRMLMHMRSTAASFLRGFRA